MITLEQFTEIILPHTLKWEGGYVNDPADRGGETYRGISRRANPNWQGWQCVDSHKPLRRGDIINDSELKRCVASLYYERYFVFDRCNSSILAAVLFDYAVNGGYRATKLQTILNKLGNCLIVDNVLGAKSWEAANSADVKVLCHAILDDRRNHYNQIIKDDYTLEKFRDGWFNRLLYFRKLVNLNC